MTAEHLIPSALAPVDGEWNVVSRAAEETRSLAAALGRIAEPGTVVLLVGDLGSGKTVFAQGVGKGLAVGGVVNSPTFVLVNEHLSGRLPLFHADLYRLEGADEIAELALPESGMGAVLLVEWPERAWTVAGLLPSDALRVQLEPNSASESVRAITITAHGDHAHQLLQAWQREFERGV